MLYFCVFQNDCPSFVIFSFLHIVLTPSYPALTLLHCISVWEDKANLLNSQKSWGEMGHVVNFNFNSHQRLWEYVGHVVRCLYKIPWSSNNTCSWAQCLLLARSDDRLPSYHLPEIHWYRTINATLKCLQKAHMHTFLKPLQKEIKNQNFLEKFTQA